MNNFNINNHVFSFAIEAGNIYLVLKKENHRLSIPKYNYDGKSSLENSALENFFNDTNIKSIYHNQCHVFSKNNNIDVIIVSFFKKTQNKIKENYELYSIYDIDSKLICKETIDYLKDKLVYSSYIKNLMPEYFSLRELQDLYEKLFAIELDRRNFRKHLVALNAITETEEYKRKNTNGRPNKLYKFNDEVNIKLV